MFWISSRRLDRMEDLMSALTDQIDAALAALQANEADEAARLAVAEGAVAGLQAQIDALTAGGAADQAELQKVLDALKALVNAPKP